MPPAPASMAGAPHLQAFRRTRSRQGPRPSVRQPALRAARVRSLRCRLPLPHRRYLFQVSSRSFNAPEALCCPVRKFPMTVARPLSDEAQQAKKALEDALGGAHGSGGAQRWKQIWDRLPGRVKKELRGKVSKPSGKTGRGRGF